MRDCVEGLARGVSLCVPASRYMIRMMTHMDLEKVSLCYCIVASRHTSQELRVLLMQGPVHSKHMPLCALQGKS